MLTTLRRSPNYKLFLISIIFSLSAWVSALLLVTYLANF